KSLVTFFLLTFALTWTSWFAAAAVSGSFGAGVPALAELQTPLIYLGIFAPAIVAIALTARAEGRAGVQALLRRLFHWQVGGRWYVFALGYMAAIKLTVALLHRIAMGEWPRFGQEAWYLMVGATILSVIVGGQTGEEIGWRGYALPGLAARMGLAPASVLLGVIWASWHLPLFYILGGDTVGQSFPLYLLQVTALSVAIAWLYAHTNGSLLLTMLLHSAVNNTKDIVPSVVTGATKPFGLSTSLVAWMTLALLWICAAYFLARMPKFEDLA
ncbi:MAG: CPBP family intramembrane glutamic endopeptidase, partial [Gemmatimonadaceae bacterium]